MPLDLLFSSALSPLAFFSFGFTELLVVGTVALIVYGGDLPDVMRNLGRTYAKFRQGLSDMSKPVRDEFRSHARNVPTTADVLRSEPKDQPTPPQPDGTSTETAEETPDAAAEKPRATNAPRYPKYEAPSGSQDDPWDDLDEPPPV